MNDVELRKFIWERCEADDQKTDEIMAQIARLFSNAKMPEKHRTEGLDRDICLINTGRNQGQDDCAPYIARLLSEKEAAEDKIKRLEGEIASLKSRAGDAYMIVRKVLCPRCTFSKEACEELSKKHPDCFDMYKQAQAVSDMMLGEQKGERG